MKKTLLRVENIRKSFGDLEVLKGVTFDLNLNETVVIIGPSGSGKSTLLRCINLLVEPDEGRIWLGGEEITRKGVDKTKVRKKVQMVFQHFNLFDHLTALRNVSLGPRYILGYSKEAATKIAIECLEKVGMEKWKDHYPAELSGGQKQRVAIARALAMNPKIILFDEPTSALDPELIGEVLEVMRELSRSGLTNLTVTHEIGFAKEVADRILFLCDGIVLEQGSPKEVLESPKHDRTKRFLHKITELYGTSGEKTR